MLYIQTDAYSSLTFFQVVQNALIACRFHQLHHAWRAVDGKTSASAADGGIFICDIRFSAVYCTNFQHISVPSFIIILQ